MRIDDTDPDELEDLDRGIGKRTWLVLGGTLVAVALVVAGVLFVRGRDDGTAATTTTEMVAETIAEEPEEDPIEVPMGPGEFPDFGSDYVGPKLEVLYQRVTEAGIRLSMQNNGDWNEFFPGGFVEGDGAANAVPETIAAAPPATVVPDTVGSGDEGNGGWVPADWCNPIGGLRLGMAYKEAIGVANGQRYAGPRDGRLSVTLFSAGHAEGQPFRALVLQVAADTTLATATWGDGAADGAAPVNGSVVLATPGDSSVEFDITLSTPAGDVVVEYDDMPRDGDAGWMAGCQPPPPELPPPGEQPDDPAAAEQAVRDVFDLLWDRDIPLDEKVVLDDDTGVADAIDQVDAGGFGDAAQTAVHRLTEVVFVSPDEAWFTYDLETTVTDFTNRFGIAYRIDGVWVISRAVICQDLALGGGQCFPFVDQIYPPGSEPQPAPFDDFATETTALAFEP